MHTHTHTHFLTGRYLGEEIKESLNVIIFFFYW